MGDYDWKKTIWKLFREWIWGALGILGTFSATYLADLPLEYQTGACVAIMGFISAFNNWYKHHNK